MSEYISPNGLSPLVEVRGDVLTINLAGVDLDKPNRYLSGWAEINSDLLDASRRVLAQLREDAENERLKLEKKLEENKLIAARLREFLSDDEMRALNAAGLGGAVNRIAAGLNAAKWGDAIRVSVTLPEEERGGSGE